MICFHTFRYSLLLPVLLTACQGPGAAPASPPSNANSLSAATLSATKVGPPALVPEEVSLTEVCALALKHHPELQSFPYEERAADARRLIAQRPPNPSLEIDFEDLAGTGQFSGIRSAVYTGTLVQTLETGGKRNARAASATAQVEQLRAEYEVRRREILSTASQEFISTLATKEELSLSERELTLAESGLLSVQEQVRAGRATESQRKIAELAVIDARLAQRSAQRKHQQSLKSLASLWGQGESSFRVKGSLSPPIPSLPSRQRLVAALESHPEFLRARTTETVASAAVNLARAARSPDINVGFGARHDQESGADALVFGASLPLPLFEPGHDAVTAAESEAQAATLRTNAVRADLLRRFDTVWSHYTDATDAALTVEKELLPEARAVFANINESYEVGRTNFLEWLEARRQLAAANRRWLEARRDYQQAAASLQALTGLFL